MGQRWRSNHQSKPGGNTERNPVKPRPDSSGDARKLLVLQTEADALGGHRVRAVRVETHLERFAVTLTKEKAVKETQS